MTTAFEDRLRAALSARAGRITVADLQPAAPPSLLARRERDRRFTWSRLVPVLAGAAVTAVVVIFAVVLAWPPGPSKRAPDLPGNAPATTSSTPAPAPSVAPTASPSPSRRGRSTIRPPAAVPSRSRPATAGSEPAPSTSPPVHAGPTTTPSMTNAPSPTAATG
jgi:hypothetical protein